MKTSKKIVPTAPFLSSPIKMLALAAGLILPAATGMAQTYWQGGPGTNDFNNPALWNGTYIDDSSDANPNPNCSNDNGSNNVVLIQAGDPAWYHGDTLAGNNANDSGAYLQTGSTNNTGYPNNGNWLRMGINSGTAGYYILSNGVVNVAGQTHLGEHGFGYLEVDGGVYNTGYNGNPGICAGDGDFGVSSGMLVLTGGAVNNINNETWFGEGSGCTGFFNMSGGTLSANNWFVFGRNGGVGYGTMTGGTLTFTGGGNFLIGGGGIGSLAQSGGIINAFNAYLVPQSHTSLGTNILSGSAALTVHSWLTVGRGGYGEMDISGNASVTHNDSGSHFDIGAGGDSSGGAGVLNQNGGTITEATSDFWMGEAGPATWNLNAGTADLLNLVMSVNNGITSTLNLNGGLLQVNAITSSSSLSISTLNLNGGTLQARMNNPVFINGVYQVQVGAGGAVLDSQAYTVTIPEALQDNNGGAASVTKLGSGTVILSGGNTFGGAMTVSNGLLEVSTASSPVSGGGAVLAADGAGFGTLVSSANGQLPVASLTMGGATGGTLFFDLGGYGNPTMAPLAVAGAFTANGTITVNVAASVLAVGTVPLAQCGSVAGAPSFVMGSLPSGVVANLAVAGNILELVVTSAGAPRWNGNVTGDWDFGSNQDWFDLGTLMPTTYKDGEPVVFDDNATGTTTVNLTATVSPASVNFNNNSLPYAIVGTGKISGKIGININGPGMVAIQNTGGNNFTGPVSILGGGTLSVTNLANGGSPSPLGASTAGATNLVINDGTLSYGGAPVTVNRGFTVAGTNTTIDAEANLALSGNVTAVNNLIDGGSALTKVGPAQLAFVGSGDNEFSVNHQAGINLVAGTLLFDGSVGNQTNHTQNEFWIGSTAASGAALVLTNASFNVDNWVGLGRINGGVNNTSSITLYNSVLHCGNLSLGWDGGQPNNLSSQFITLNGNSALTNYGNVNLAEGANASFSLNVNNNSVFWVQNPMYICFAANTTGSVVVANSGKIFSANGWFDIGQGVNCVASLLAKDNANLTVNNGDLNLADTAAGAVSTLTVQDNATVQANTLWVGKSQNSVCTATFSNSASANFNSYIDLASGGSSTGTLNISGASVTSGGDMTVGDQGTAVVNLVANSGATLTVHGTLYLSRGSETANGTVNLNAGTTIVAGYVNNGWGFTEHFASPLDNPNTFNFNGGTLKAFVGSAYFIQPYVNAVVQSGGAIIDDGGYSIEVLTALVTGGGNGGLTKVGNGTLRLDGVNTYTGGTVVSSGTLQVGPGGVIAGPVTVNSGATLAGDAGAIETYNINSSLTLSAGSTTTIGIAPASNDQISGLTGVQYGGALVVNNLGGSPLTPGHIYQLFNSAVAGTGNFSSVTILPAGAYTGTFNPANGTLTIASAVPPTVNPPMVSGGNLVLSGSGGTPGGTYSWLTATNVTTALANWTTNTTGVFGGNGAFTNAIPVSAGTPAQFFRLKTP